MFVVACSGLFLKENGEREFVGLHDVGIADGLPNSSATEIEGTFRVNGSNKRMRELQAIFETPPRVRVFFFHSITRPLLTLPAAQYGKSLDWKAENYTTHDVASVFRRYLTHMPVRCPDVYERALSDVRASCLVT